MTELCTKCLYVDSKVNKSFTQSRMRTRVPPLTASPTYGLFHWSYNIKIIFYFYITSFVLKCKYFTVIFNTLLFFKAG